MSRLSKLSKFRKGKIILRIINDLNEIENKRQVTIESEYGCRDERMLKKIAERTGIQFRDRCEAGVVPINEFITISFESYEDLELYPDRRSCSMNRPFQFPEIKVSEALKKSAEDFEKANIPSTGPCKTRIGEMFRAIQRIQYRAFNDGDLPWMIGSPSFLSLVFLMSEADKLNYSGYAYREETGTYKFEFSEDVLNNWTDNGKLFVECDDPLCQSLDFTKYQLIDLLNRGIIKDSPNEIDSRDLSLLRSNNY
jgi:hypothetical protein